MDKDKFQISLRENGEHSFKKSLESYEEYERTKDQMLLKDTIMFLHHSIELLMKEMLVRHSQYLIFEDLKDVPRKQKEANKKGIGIFFIDNPPKSVTYEVAIDRVEAFLNPSELDDSLKQNLVRLNRLRNQLEHYAIDVDKEEVLKIINAIHKPVLNLFEKHLGSFAQLKTNETNKTLNKINHGVEEYQRKSHEIYVLMRMFDGQRVPGQLFGIEKEVILPKFDDIHENYRTTIAIGESSFLREFDIWAESKNLPLQEDKTKWVVEIKTIIPGAEVVYSVNSYGKLSGATPWLVVFNKIPNLTRAVAKELNVMVTSSEEIEELKKLLKLDLEK